jgi:hypothetical protein
MSTTEQDEMGDRLHTLLQDADLRRQQDQARAGTFFSHAQSAANDTAGGRFAAISQAQVVGAVPVPKYPAASSSHQVELPPEQPLGFSVDDMPIEPSAVVTAAEQLGGAAAAPPSSCSLLSDVERAAPPSFSAIGGGPAPAEAFPAAATATAGPSSTNAAHDGEPDA